jgi:hypothetical protein
MPDSDPVQVRRDAGVGPRLELHADARSPGMHVRVEAAEWKELNVLIFAAQEDACVTATTRPRPALKPLMKALSLRGSARFLLRAW